jgi:hypothetical protein
MLRVKQRVEIMIKPHMLEKLYGKPATLRLIMVQGIMEGEKSSYN